MQVNVVYCLLWLVVAYKGVMLHSTNFAFGVRTIFTKCTEELDCLIWCVRVGGTMHDVYKCDLTLGENGGIASL